MTTPVTIRFYGYAKCGTCQKAKKWLLAHSIPFDEQPIRDRPPSEAELKRMLDQHLDGNTRKLLNTSSQDYREANLKDRVATMRREELISMLRENGNLIKRPFVLTESDGTVGFQEEVWKKKFLG